MNFRLQASPQFPQGTLVGAYLKRTFAGPPPVPGETAGGAPLIGTATVEAQGYALFEGLEAETGYYVGAEVNGAWRWKSIVTSQESVFAAVEAERLRAEAAERALGALNAANPPGITNPGPTTATAGSPTELLLVVANATGTEVVGLPTGLTYDPVARRIKGTPSSAETKTTTIRASGPGGSAEAQFVWTVSSAANPVITKPANQTVQAGVPVVLQVSATNTSAYEATGLPTGLQINKATGLITGTATTAETPEATIKATGPSGGTAESKFKWTVTAAAVSPAFQTGEPKANGVASSKEAPLPPEGTSVGDLLLMEVQLEGSATLTGIPTGWTQIGALGAISTHNFYVLWRRYDGSAMPTLTASASVEWDIRVLRITGGEAVNVNSGWSNQASAGTVSIASVTTPTANELVVAITCKIGGATESTPAGFTAFNSKNQFRVYYKNQAGAEASGSASATLSAEEASTAITFAIAPISSPTATEKLSTDHKSVEPVFLPSGTAHIAVERSAVETGESGQSLFETILSSQTVIPGTVAKPWVAILALNANFEALGSYTARIKTTPEVKVPVIAKPLPQSGNVAKATSLQIAATEVPTSYTLTKAPTGLTINSSGLISGTPSKAGNYSVQVTATNAAGTSAVAEWEWAIGAETSKFTTGLVMNSDTESAPSLAAIAFGAKVVRCEFAITTAASAVLTKAELMSGRGTLLQPMIGFTARIPSAAEAKSVKAWAEVLGWPGYPLFEFGNETNYPNQVANTKANGELYGTRAKECAEAIQSIGTKLLIQGSDAGTGQHTWLDGIFAVWPGIASHPAFGGWTIHSYPGSHVFGEKDTFGVPMMERLIKALEEKGEVSSGIYVTEWGVPCTSEGRTMTSGQSMDWSEGAKVLEGHIALLENASKKRMKQLLLYQAHDQQPEVATDTEREHFFGVLQSSGAAKGAFTTFAQTFL